MVYAIWQFFPAARASRLQYRARAWISASALLNALWIGVVQFGWLPVSLVVIVVLLLVLIRTLLLLITTRPRAPPNAGSSGFSSASTWLGQRGHHREHRGPARLLGRG
ncbi:hypothetical protein [Arthrobacter sp. JCM 19049]|uniref:hypothetical protein n=1 Tax=Arthrobacter sp. JCM 19049 TaxID=1460643 RepID=UPI002436F27C|nr:hypothetical protein [Arthrobacter sp. JCM 19049]